MSAESSTDRIGRFHLIRPLGEGMQGKVYLAVDPQLRRKVAIKVLTHATGIPGEAGVAPSEALHLAELRHPNIVSVHEVGEHVQTPFIVCEFVEGELVRDVIAKRGALPLGTAMRTVLGVLEGMAHAHARGVCHLDLSPSNLMIDGEGVARIMDFGLSRKHPHSTPTSDTVYGALAYMAPEHLRNQTLDARTDVYALGLIAYELLTGIRANGARGRTALFQNILRAQVDPAPLLEMDPSGELAQWVATATEKDPTRRFQNAGAMLEALRLTAPLRGSGGGAARAGGDATAMDYLMFRMRRKKDFPALSGTLMEINRLTAEDASTSVSVLANKILCDYALTNKLLKLANSPFFGGGGRTVKSVTDAIRVLGMSQVRQASTALLSLQQYDGALDNEELADTLNVSFTAGLVARHVAQPLGAADAEQAFIAGLFQGMGRSLAICHFAQEHAEIKAMVARDAVPWPEAQVEVLGVTYQELGRAVARLWGFPEPLILDSSVANPFRR